MMVYPKIVHGAPPEEYSQYSLPIPQGCTTYYHTIYNDTAHFLMEKYNRSYYFKKVKEIWTRGRNTLGWGEI